jgi:hypothetical protein
LYLSALKANKMRVKFKHSEIGSFFQAMPRLQNPYTADAFLRRLLKRMLPPEVRHFMPIMLYAFFAAAKHPYSNFKRIEVGLVDDDGSRTGLEPIRFANMQRA